MSKDKYLVCKQEAIRHNLKKSVMDFKHTNILQIINYFSNCGRHYMVPRNPRQQRVIDASGI